MKKILLLPLLLIPMFLLQKPVTVTGASYAPNQIPNGGFETGNLDGWQRFGLWKGETPMLAFNSSLVTNGTYFDYPSNNPVNQGYRYNRDGSYNLGITSTTVTWDQTTERMGYLRSADFTLGGSGWMSFKLGGAQYSQFAYVSIRQTADDIEVARFGNRHWNDTTLAGTIFTSAITNAEAFMFPYYFDLSSVVSIGTGLYIVLADTAAYDWSIISADSFVTYYATDPTIEPTWDALASNILPTVQGIATASNTILNGHFVGDFENWTVDGNGWYFSSDIAYSNQTGNGNMGILRSSAFTVTTNKYLRWDWAGGLKWDKQIFLSVKETGTNIEKLRFVVRSDLASKESSAWDNHIGNLSGLDTSKKYYLEYADARTASWGVSIIDNIRLDPSNDPAGDRAVSISDLPLTFTTSASESAITYAAFFLEQTASSCSASSGGSMSTDGTWTSLSNEYATLSSAAKDYFAGSTTEVILVEARARYLVLIDTYASLATNKFVVDGLGVQYSGVENNTLTHLTDNITIVFIVLLGITALAAFSILIFKRRSLI